MSRFVRCRRCGALFVPDRFAALLRCWRLCPRCRGTLRLTDGVPATDGAILVPGPPEAAP